MGPQGYDGPVGPQGATGPAGPSGVSAWLRKTPKGVLGSAQAVRMDVSEASTKRTEPT